MSCLWYPIHRFANILPQSKYSQLSLREVSTTWKYWHVLVSSLMAALCKSEEFYMRWNMIQNLYFSQVFSQEGGEVEILTHFLSHIELDGWVWKGPAMRELYSSLTYMWWNWQCCDLWYILIFILSVLLLINMQCTYNQHDLNILWFFFFFFYIKKDGKYQKSRVFWNLPF